MIYSNPEFILLFLATALLFFLFTTYTIRFYILLISSFAFYAWAGAFDTFIFAMVLIVSWVATWLGRKFPRHRKIFITTGIVVMVLHLFFWKYFPWIVRETQKIFPHFLNGKKLNLPLPVGISFFTLQGIAYLVDYYKAETKFINFREYLLFKSFFAQLVAGPIARAQQLMPYLKTLKTPQPTDIFQGISLFCIGFFKKIILADRSAPFIDIVFSNPSQYNRKTLFLALLGYTVQIWADFSGYTDMGRGSAKILGIHLPENFLSPYLSRSPSEFWHRWHISLSQWIRDYIYIPLGGSRGNLLQVCFVLLLTMGISGLWHGANWTFLCFGIYHGFLLISENFIKKSPINALFKTLVPSVFIQNIFLTAFVFVISAMMGWLFFRAQTIDDVVLFLRGILLNNGTAGAPISRNNIYFSIASCAFLQIIFYYHFKKNEFVFLSTFSVRTKKILYSLSESNELYVRFIGLTCGILLAALFMIIIFMQPSTQIRPFIYFQF